MKDRKELEAGAGLIVGKQDTSAVRLCLNRQGKEPRSTVPSGDSLTAPGRGSSFPCLQGEWLLLRKAAAQKLNLRHLLAHLHSWGSSPPAKFLLLLPMLLDSSWGLSSFSFPSLAGHCCLWGAGALAKFMLLQLAAEDKAPWLCLQWWEVCWRCYTFIPLCNAEGRCDNRILAALHILSCWLLESYFHFSEDSIARREQSRPWKSRLLDPEHK